MYYFLYEKNTIIHKLIPIVKIVFNSIIVKAHSSLFPLIVDITQRDRKSGRKFNKSANKLFDQYFDVIFKPAESLTEFLILSSKATKH